MTERRYGDEEVREIFSLATTGGMRDQSLPSESGGLTLDELQRIGRGGGHRAGASRASRGEARRARDAGASAAIVRAPDRSVAGGRSSARPNGSGVGATDISIQDHVRGAWPRDDFRRAPRMVKRRPAHLRRADRAWRTAPTQRAQRGRHGAQRVRGRDGRNVGAHGCSGRCRSASRRRRWWSSACSAEWRWPRSEPTWFARRVGLVSASDRWRRLPSMW